MLSAVAFQVILKSTIHLPPTFHTMWSFAVAFFHATLPSRHKGNRDKLPCTLHSVESMAFRAPFVFRHFVEFKTSERTTSQSSSKNPEDRFVLASLKVDLGTD